MDGIALAVSAIKLLVRLVPPPPPPKIDYGSIIRAMPRGLPEPSSSLLALPDTSEEAPLELAPGESLTTEVPEPAEQAGGKKPVATSCIACSRSHLVTIAGALDESLRFAREGGVTNPEALRRIDAAEKEVVMMERIDLSPEAIRNSPPAEQKMARLFLPKIRQLRQDIGQIASVDQLEKTAAEASVLSQEFRLRQMELQGVNLNPILELAKKVSSGELTMEEAKAKVKEYLPNEEG